MEEKRAIPHGVERHALHGLLGMSWIVMAMDMSMLPVALKALEEHFNAAPVHLGMIVMAQGVGGCLSSPLWGHFADRFDRLRLIYISMLGLSIFTLVTAFTTTLSMLIMSRFFAGVLAAALGPITQAMITSAVVAEERGKYFGLMTAISQLGTVLGLVHCTMMSRMDTFEHQGWRFAFISMGILTLTFGTSILMLQARLSRYLRSALVNTSKTNSVLMDFRLILSRNSVKLVMLQGVFSSLVASAMTFLLVIFQYINLSNLEASTIVSFSIVGSGIGALVSGYMSDALVAQGACKDRIFHGQVSVMVCLVMFCLLPWPHSLIMSSPGYAMLACVVFSMGFLHIMAYSCTVLPILSEIVPSHVVGQAFGCVCAVDGAVSTCLGAPIVGFVAEYIFGFHEPRVPLARLPDDLREINHSALCSAFFLVTGICWTMSLIILSLLHWTYDGETKTCSAQAHAHERKESIASERQRAV